MKYNTGDKPGKGSYKCTTCGEIIVLEKDTDFLPPCPRCRHMEFEKI
ncbi:hypothetical protein ACJDU8_18270 [Clostridium sp. WILCCON 0269]|uniref:Rubredoxin-like protein n=1 Tax=Candidatus Clostridium eludens TaxID=3381663 RepID=A0ABW8SP94_9CLOT